MKWLQDLIPIIVSAAFTVLVAIGYNKRRFEDIEEEIEEFKALDLAIKINKISDVLERIKKIEDLDLKATLQSVQSDLKSLNEKLCELKKADEKRASSHETYMDLLNGLKLGQDLIMQNFELKPKE